VLLQIIKCQQLTRIEESSTHSHKQFIKRLAHLYIFWSSTLTLATQAAMGCEDRITCTVVNGLFCDQIATRFHAALYFYGPLVGSFKTVMQNGCLQLKCVHSSYSVWISVEIDMLFAQKAGFFPVKAVVF